MQHAEINRGGKRSSSQDHSLIYVNKRKVRRELRYWEKKMSSKMGRRKKKRKRIGGTLFHQQPVSSLTFGNANERFLFFFFFYCRAFTRLLLSRPETRLAIEHAFYVREARQRQRMQSAFVSIASQFPMPMDGASNKNMPIQREKKQCDAENGQVYWKRRQSPIQPRTHISLNS